MNNGKMMQRGYVKRSTLLSLGMLASLRWWVFLLHGLPCKLRGMKLLLLQIKCCWTMGRVGKWLVTLLSRLESWNSLCFCVCKFVCVGEDCLRMSVFCGGCGCGGVCRWCPGDSGREFIFFTFFFTYTISFLSCTFQLLMCWFGYMLCAAMINDKQ